MVSELRIIWKQTVLTTVLTRAGRYSGFNGTIGAICLHQNPVEAASAGIVMGDDMTHVRAPCMLRFAC